ncbi:RNA-binding cell elongation regulator Jag/EloR [Oceanidesulfovibrio indonesiensis]|uniref:RNA-binding cell elongation regulator Jag/EloR n=1 Tax=Oceanidesulfovibrio indonesiensis TaxID=54767 RepID=UPI001AC005F5|nr:RNA-binding cell elongation regulator Jag/EloR [Oceanidesulfovibrio indonesiensis]
MNTDAKEFEGKSIDEAIDEACRYFDVEREALEIEILQDASGGIFGLVGGRKASVRARLRDQSVELRLFVRDVLGKLLEPIVENPSLDIRMDSPSRVTAVIDDEEQAGLIIGKEGVTLQALQYIANRILAKQWPEPVRLRLDAGEYRERQNESLRELALSLAEKAVAQNRAQSTRPLSSFHRRVVHMALQDDETVQTRSKGEGPMKRVVIQPADAKGRTNGNAQDEPDGESFASIDEPNGNIAEGNSDNNSAANSGAISEKRKSSRRRGSGSRGRRRGGRNNRSKPDADSASPESPAESE